MTTAKALDVVAPEGVPPQSAALQIDMARVLMMPLGCQLLGVDLSAGLYLRNGFRFIGTRASIDEPGLESAAQRFRNLFRMNRAAATRFLIQTGYDAHTQLEADEVEECLSHLQNPRQRILDELFWPHVPDDLFASIKSNSHLAGPLAVQALAEDLNQSSGRANVLAKHALALVYHNQAIAHEIAFAAGKAEWSAEHWTNALSYWSEVLESELFWDYLCERVVSFDDPRISRDDVGLLRAQLPAAILGFNTLFARTYAKAAANTACQGHLAVINHCGLRASAREGALQSTVRALAAAQFEPVVNKVDAKLLGASSKLNRKPFDAICAPLLDEVFAVRRYLAEDLDLPGNLVEMSEFDRVCEKLLSAINGKINYDNDDRLRSILFSTLITRKMLSLPLSQVMRQKLEKSIRSDAEIVYRGLLTSSTSPDPTQCWFLEGELADPDASIELPLYKVTSREVKVDFFQETGGVSVRYESRNVLVPRCREAEARHSQAGGKSEPFESKATNETSRKWARFLAFFAGANILSMALAFLLRRVLLRDLPDRRQQLPIGGIAFLGLFCSSVILGILIANLNCVGRSRDPHCEAMENLIHGAYWLVPLIAVIAFGIAAYRAFKPPARLEAVAAPETARDTRSVKPYSSAKDHPAHKAAMAKGYSAGKGPSPAEMEMTYSEREEAQRKLSDGLFDLIRRRY